MTVLDDAVLQSVAVFTVCAFAGVVIETAHGLLVEKPGVLESRSGLVYLPLNPLYGVAAVVAAALLRPLAEWPLLVFVVGLVAATGVEFVASVVLERGCGVVLWDYRAQPLNLHGRICARYALVWGVLALVLVYALDPAIRVVVLVLPRPVAEAGALVVVVAVTGCAVLTAVGLRRVARLVAAGGALADESRTDRVVARLVPATVVQDTFPNGSSVRALACLTGREPRRIRLWRQRSAARPRRAVHDPDGRGEVQQQVVHDRSERRARGIGEAAADHEQRAVARRVEQRLDGRSGREARAHGRIGRERSREF